MTFRVSPVASEGAGERFFRSLERRSDTNYGSWYKNSAARQLKPAGLTLEQFEIALRTGYDQLDPKRGLLDVMPWPSYRHMTGRDLDAIYTCPSALPSAKTPVVHCKNVGR